MVLRIISMLVLFSILLNCAAVVEQMPKVSTPKQQKSVRSILKRVNHCIKDNMSVDNRGPIPVNTKIDSVAFNQPQHQLSIYLSKHFSYQALRPADVSTSYQLFKKYLGRKYRKYALTLYSLNEPISNLVPNFFRENKADYDQSRLPAAMARTIPPILQCLNTLPWRPTNGLFNRNIALWHSHGFYYDKLTDRWEWQRPRLFITVEDLLPMSFVIPYIVPMLEKAGANVFLPRERDLQTNEVVVDNDQSEGDSYLESEPEYWYTSDHPGFRQGTPPYPANFNPFLQGTSRYCSSTAVNSTYVEWIPVIPQDGYYGVYISYSASPENVTDARYTVYHRGGSTDYLVNQQIGGSTWLYLGQFKFKKGIHPACGKVVLWNKSDSPGKIISADAVRFGGGMGNILRGGQTSGYPRFAEAARYYLQYTGMPDTLVYHLHKDSSDYRDDYQSRGEFVNYLKGRPFGPNGQRDVRGLGIPIDLSLAFHTDAGIDTSKTAIGTLMIYSVMGADTQAIFPDGISRLANRDLADIMQTQIVDDIQQKYNINWRRRALMDAEYSEAVRPNVPACLLELLSHQNFTDMQYALSPQFRFDAARAIYKGILKFLATQYQFDYVVQPLPVSHVHAYFSDNAQVTLRWQAVADPLEPGAIAENFLIYTSIDDNGFDNGTFVDTTEFVVQKLLPAKIYNFKISAVNRGGESFPSEVISVCWLDNERPPVLIVNGFDRVGPPQFINEPNFKGCATFLDPGVADQYNFNFTGMQYDFDPQSKYISNDAPGHGASHANNETRIIPGNTFDFAYIHGSAIANCGYSFVTTSDEALVDGLVDCRTYKIMDVIFGEEKTSVFPPVITNTNPHLLINAFFQVFPVKLQAKIWDFCRQQGRVFISGAYVATDLLKKPTATKMDSIFAVDVLKINWRADHAAVSGKVFAADSSFLPKFIDFNFNTEWSPKIYRVESPDALTPVGGAKTILRYAENRYSAATAYVGEYTIIVFGFPFETIIDEAWRNTVMKAILNYGSKF